MLGMFNLPGANRTQPVPGTIAPPVDAPLPAPPVYFNQAAAFSGPGGNQNMSRQSRRLYVGSITYEANEENIAAFFNAKMIETGLGTGGPGDAVIGVQINHEKSYAFVEVCSRRDDLFICLLNSYIFLAFISSNPPKTPLLPWLSMVSFSKVAH
jgi:splicing factor U2AF subunit